MTDDVVVELMHEGWLVKGTTSTAAALAAIKREVPDFSLEDCALRPGRYRKVPGQWSPWTLHDGIGPGSFEAVTVKLPPGAPHPQVTR